MPYYRKKGLGDYLLKELMGECRALGATVLLLVHDDNGTGKLVNYYERRGFKMCNVLSKGLLFRL